MIFGMVDKILTRTKCNKDQASNGKVLNFEKFSFNLVNFTLKILILNKTCLRCI